MTVYCNDCTYIGDSVEFAVKYREYHSEVSCYENYATFECPHCGSDDCEEAVLCDTCHNYHLVRESYLEQTEDRKGWLRFCDQCYEELCDE